MKRLHMICNAHLDPYWQWDWDEGAAAAISTYRTAADLCEEFDGFVFNHNEVILYRWIEEYEPALFARILESDSALYQEYVDRDRVLGDLRRHLAGADLAEKVCRYVTIETWLRQVYEGKRPTVDADEADFGPDAWSGMSD